MLLPAYLFVLGLAAAASHVAIYRREGRAAELLYNAAAALMFTLAGVASLNVEHGVGGTPDTASSVYLATLWLVFAAVNVLFVIERLASVLDADEDFLEVLST
jgi:hypothetical protein